ASAPPAYPRRESASAPPPPSPRPSTWPPSSCEAPAAPPPPGAGSRRSSRAASRGRPCGAEHTHRLPREPGSPEPGPEPAGEGEDRGRSEDRRDDPCAPQRSPPSRPRALGPRQRGGAAQLAERSERLREQE